MNQPTSNDTNTGYDTAAEIDLSQRLQILKLAVAQCSPEHCPNCTNQPNIAMHINTENNRNAGSPEADAMLESLQATLYVINDIANDKGPASVGGRYVDTSGDRE